LFRNTFVTGKVLFGTKFREVTAMIDHDVTPPAVEYRTVKGAVLPITKDSIWKTVTNTRRVAKHTVRNDARFSPDGPSMFNVPMRNLTNAKGEIKGSKENTVQFILHMLANGKDSTWGSETRTDRENDARILIAALHS
jgi:hypothetical protein